MAETEIKAVIFDLDGVLMDSEPVYAAMLARWLWENKFAAAVQEKINSVVQPGITWEAIFNVVNSIAHTGFNPKREQEKISDWIVQYILDTGVPLKAGAIEAVQSLAQRYQLGVTSSAVRRVIERLLRHHGLYEYFQQLTSIEDVTFGKPHPEPYQKTMAALQTRPEETVVIEDSLSGAQAAAAAGIFVYILPDSNAWSPQKLNTIGQVVPSFATILNELL